MERFAFAKQLKNLRSNAGLKLKEVSSGTGIDQALISKFESGKRLPTDTQLIKLASFYQCDYKVIRTYYLAEKICTVLQYEPMGLDALQLAEPRIEYLKSVNATSLQKISPEIINRLDQLDKLKLTAQSSKTNDDIRLHKLEDHFRINYTYESNKIEGNTLTLSETMMVVKEGLTIAGKSINEHLEAINHSEAIELIYDLLNEKVILNKYTLLQIHGLILRGINRKYAGIFRDVPVRITGAEHVPPEPYLIDKLMEDYFIYFSRHKLMLHPVILAAEMHERLVSIHPFIDGNGRTSRLVMNLILLSNGYTIVNLKGDNESRLQYFKSLEACQVDNDSTMFYNLIIDRLEASLIEYIELAG